MPSAVFVPAAATREVLDWDDAIAAMRGAYAAPHAPRTSQRAQALRTAATSAVALDCMAPRRALSLAALGPTDDPNNAFFVGRNPA